MPSVAVLLSSYNGARFIGAQMTSILAQLPEDGELIIRDDGSRDGTLEEIARVDDRRVRLIGAGPNIGFVASFFALMRAVPPDCGTVMFSDQDDVWLPGKIAAAQEALAARGPGPVLYACQAAPVDEGLAPLAASGLPGWPRGASFANALSENIISGCTAAINRAALRRVLDLGVDAGEIAYHDWWIYLVVAAFGEVVLDERRLMLWRRHGGAATLAQTRLRLLSGAFTADGWVSRMARQNRAFHRAAGGQLTGAQRRLMERHADFGRPIAFAASPVRLRQLPRHDVFLRGAVLLRALLPGLRVAPYSPQR